MVYFPIFLKAESEANALVLRVYESFGGHNSSKIVSHLGICKVQRYIASHTAQFSHMDIVVDMDICCKSEPPECMGLG